jgi:ABC-type transport system involved in Fe-S cluster assembly fused permease/ATPase subunit
MLQSIDESKFNLFQRVATWPKRKTDAMKDFFRSNLPMLRFLWPEDSPRLKLFLVLSMIFMFFGKWFNLRVPFIMQRSIDMISTNPDASFHQVAVTFVVYGLARAMSTVCAEIKTCLFVHVSQNVLRKFANQIFSHLHALDASFHLGTPSGVISVAYVRAVRGFQTMLFQLVFSVAPTFLELAMVSHVMYKKFDPIFALVTMVTFTSYLIFTVGLTQWRVHLRQELVDVDNARNGFFIDSILNHEIVKLFNNEKKELQRFDGYLAKLQQLSIDSTVAIAWLNLGQACMFSMGLTANLLIAFDRVRRGKMSVGDLIAVNAMLLQLAVPFNFIGYTYQELRQSFVDMGYIREIVAGREPLVVDAPQAASLDTLAPRQGPSSLEFRNVTFRYADQGDVHQLRGVSFQIKPGQSVAIVGPSGSGKSTTLKLITRMIEPISGAIYLDGVPTTAVTRSSVLSRIAVVPQDCSLFDDTIEYNIRYGAANATMEALNTAVDRANLRPTINKLADGLKTMVGERGAKLSGGERQKVSIARAMLRDPSLILCDEVTSSVDAFAEREIVETLLSATAERTTITVAHRLSSIAHSDVILVMNKGELVEQGTHEMLLTRPNGLYRSMWLAQNLIDDRGYPQLAHNNDDGDVCPAEEGGSEPCGAPYPSAEHTNSHHDPDFESYFTEIVPISQRAQQYAALRAVRDGDGDGDGDGDSDGAGVVDTAAGGGSCSRDGSHCSVVVMDDDRGSVYDVNLDVDAAVATTAAFAADAEHHHEEDLIMSSSASSASSSRRGSGGGGGGRHSAVVEDAPSSYFTEILAEDHHSRHDASSSPFSSSFPSQYESLAVADRDPLFEEFFDDDQGF